MTLIDRARHLLTCDELRGRVPDEVAEFLRSFLRECERATDEERFLRQELVRLHRDYQTQCEPYMRRLVEIASRKIPPFDLYTLETPHAPE